MEAETHLDSCLDKDARSLGVNDVYEIAKLIGTELEKLIDSYGKEAVEGLIPKIVRVLEMLESFVARNGNTEQELIRAFVKLQDGENSAGHHYNKDVDQKINSWHSRIQELQAQISQLTGENQQLVNQLVEIQSQEANLSKKEREVMLKLKEVVDLQRDEIRAKGHEIYCKNEDVDALQEQLDRVLKVNNDLRHKTNIVQSQLKKVLEKKAELEVTVQEKDKELDRLQSHLAQVNKDIRNDKKVFHFLRSRFPKPPPVIVGERRGNQGPVSPRPLPLLPSPIGQKRAPTENWTRALPLSLSACDLFYQITTLGDEEDKDTLPLPSFPQDDIDSKPPESRIKSLDPAPQFKSTLQGIIFHEIQVWILELLCKVLSARFGFLYRGNSIKSPSTTKDLSEAWEVIGPQGNELVRENKPTNKN
ncbi:RILP-like protein 1 [Leucoraja erinacea]|uniref:RILP-like protein 1 n=1 Tax=Leucoraja erinaceus TaxID=7782 RepID=UPI0024549900|nr:RILP-like protein 1 [Leucoraja erinacea]